MLTGLVTALVTVLLALAPGALLGFAVPPGRVRWLVWSMAPVLTLGLVAVAVAWLPALGLPNGVGAVFVAEVVLAVAGVSWSWAVARRADRSSVRDWLRPGSERPGRPDLIGSALPAIAATAAGIALFARFPQPPGWDAMYHGLFARGMLQHGSTSAASYCLTGSTSAVPACHFYPSAADVAWAQAAWVSGGRIGTAMLTWEAVIAPAVLVVAVYVFTRLLGARSVVASGAAVACCVLGTVWSATETGRINAQLAPGLAIGVAALAVATLRRRGAVRLGVLTGVAAVGLLLTHTYEVLFAAVLALTALLTGGKRPQLRTAARALGASAVVAAVAVAPVGSAMFSAGNGRATARPPLPSHYLAALRLWVTNVRRYVLFGYPAPERGASLHAVSLVGLWLTVPCFAAAVLCFVLPGVRWARPWWWTWAIFTAVGVWTTASDSAPARAVAGLWYGVPDRLRVMISPCYAVLTVAGAGALGELAVRVARAVRRREADQAQPAAWPAAWPRRAGAYVATVVVAVLIVLAVLPSSWRPLERSLASRTPRDAAYERAFRWLASHTPNGDVVAYDQNLEMMPWSYVDHQVGFLFGQPPISGSAVADYTQRWAAWNWLVDNPGARPAGCLVNRFRVDYVAFSSDRLANFPMHYDPTRLTDDTHLALTYQTGPIVIYRVTGTGRACSAT